jgi:hypothetical protein
LPIIMMTAHGDDERRGATANTARPNHHQAGRK